MEDETDYPSFGYAQAGRSHVKMYLIDEYGIDLAPRSSVLTGQSGGTHTRQHTDEMPRLHEFPVCLPADWSAKPTPLPPLKPDLFRHVTFDTTGDLGDLLVSRPLLVAAVEALGGAFVREGEPRPPGPPSSNSRGPPWVFVIGQTAEPEWPVYSDDFLFHMILEGKRLHPATYRIMAEVPEEDGAGCTQPIRKRHRQVRHLLF
jgi:hypothetical protein